MNNKMVASESGCPVCWGSGIRETAPFYFEVCYNCGGTGLIKKEAEEDGKNEG